jgi:hypothetical protein
MPTRKVTSLLALLCMFSTLLPANLSAATPKTSAQLSSEFMSQAISIANGKYTGVRPTAAQLNQLADTFGQYLTAAEKDGTLAAKEKAIIADPKGVLDPPVPMIHGDFQTLKDHGWKGTQAELDSAIAAVTQAERSTLVQQVRSVGLKAVMQNTVTDLQNAANLADGIQSDNCHGMLIYASGLAVVGLWLSPAAAASAVLLLVYAIWC